jgi:very-short-patch-repair endonuclease
MRRSGEKGEPEGDFMRLYRRDLKQKARALRSNMTDAEQSLWSRLRRKQVLGVQFFRQRPIGDFIADFYAPTARLVVEVDGSQHLDGSGRTRDARRDAYLRDQGLQVLRFDNLQVLKELDAVMQKIYETVEQVLDAGKSPLAPPFSKGGKNSAQDLRGTNDNPDIPPFEKEELGATIPEHSSKSIPPFEKGGSGGI